MPATKRAFKWWWGWNPARIENYLEQMARQGWQTTSAYFAMMRFAFIRDEPKRVRYVMDYNFQNKIEDEYMAIAEDTGWELVGISSGWILWRKEYKGKRPEFFTDSQSIIDRNRRQLTLLSIIAAAQIPVCMMNFIDRDHSGHITVSAVILGIYIPTVALLLYGIVRLLLANRSLKRQSRR